MEAREMKPLVIKLEKNYRSGAEICAAATYLIRHNKARVDKIVSPALKDVGDVTTEAHVDEIQERASLLRTAQIWREVGTPWNEMAVVARTNAIVSEFREYLMASDIPVAKSPRAQLPADWSKAMTLLNVAIDPLNDVLVGRALAYAKSPGEVGKLMAQAIIDGIPLSQAVGGFEAPAFTHALQWLAARGVSDETLDIISARMNALPQFRPMLSDLVSDLWNAQEWLSNPAHSSGVTVATVHGVKGREFDVVFMVGLEEGLFPSAKADIEEERRLAFVGMTRARHALHLSCCRERKTKWDRKTDLMPSRFIEEATK